MKKIPFLLLSILLFVGCSDHKESPSTEETLKTALSDTWIFPTNSAFDRLEIDEEGEYELFEKKVGHSVGSFNGGYKIEEGLNVVKLANFGYFEIKSLTSNSVSIVLYNEAAQTKEEVTLTAKVPEKLLPNKEKHLAKIVNFANVFYPTDLADVVYSGDKLYRYFRVEGSDGHFCYSDFIYAADKVTFTASSYLRSDAGKGVTYFTDCVVTLDKNGRAEQVSVKSDDQESVLKCRYTVDGYIETMTLDDYSFTYVFEGGNPVKGGMSNGVEEEVILFSDFTVENKSASWLPIITLTEIVEPLQLAGLYGKPFKMLPQQISIPNENMQGRCIYEIDAQGWIKKINLKQFDVDENGKEETENLINYEYQYK